MRPRKDATPGGHPGPTEHDEPSPNIAQRRKSWREVVPVHPCAAIFPDATPQELADLARSIDDAGLRNGVTLWVDNGRKFLLDGRTRLDALELSRSVLDGESIRSGFVKETLNITSGSTPARLVIAANIRRRHLTADQKAKLAAEALAAERAMKAGISGKHFPLIDAEGGKGNKEKGTRGSVKGDVAKVAEMAGVSKPTARKAIREITGQPKASARVKGTQQPPRRSVLGPPSLGMQYARMAVMLLEQIRPDDEQRWAASLFVSQWLEGWRARLVPLEPGDEQIVALARGYL